MLLIINNYLFYNHQTHLILKKKCLKNSNYKCKPGTEYKCSRFPNKNFLSLEQQSRELQTYYINYVAHFFFEYSYLHINFV